jgi:hypothetical protein
LYVAFRELGFVDWKAAKDGGFREVSHSRLLRQKDCRVLDDDAPFRGVTQRLN